LPAYIPKTYYQLLINIHTFWIRKKKI